MPPLSSFRMTANFIHKKIPDNDCSFVSFLFVTCVIYVNKHLKAVADTLVGDSGSLELLAPSSAGCSDGQKG